MNQCEAIHNTDWDILFIIDACRYDIFKSLYRNIFKTGNLKKVISPATFTMGWMMNNFANKPQLDITYVSPDFEINSRGLQDKKIYDWERRRKYKEFKFDCKEYFKDIVDVWDFGVDKRFGVVTPETIIEEVEKRVKQDKRVIGKFWQIHDPYLYYIESDDNNFKALELGRQEYRIKTYRWINLKRVIHKYFSEVFIWRVKKLFKSKSGNGLYYFWNNFGEAGIIKGYREDLKRTLRCIKVLSDKYPEKKIVITSDHGEFLGENGRYGHGVSCENHKVIQEVPWFTMGGKDGDN